MKLISFLLVVMLSLAGCSDEQVQPDSPSNTAFLAQHHISTAEYERLQRMFFDGAAGNVSPEEFTEYQELLTTGTDYRTFELLTTDEGEMLLVEMAPSAEDQDLYEIIDIRHIPDELETFSTD